MYQFVIVIHILLGLGVIGLIMMQQGRGADAGAAFGTGASGTLFGAQGTASFLSRTTAIFATLFFITSLTLAVLSGNNKQIKDIFEQPETATAPVPDLPAIPDDVPVKVPSIREQNELKELQNKANAAQDVPATVEVAPEVKAPEVKQEAPAAADKPAKEKKSQK